MRALITDYDFPDIELEREVFRTSGVDLVEAQCKSENDLIAAARECDALLLQYAPVTDRVLAALPRIGLVSRYGAGFDTIDTEACRRHGVWVANSPDYGVGEVATHALAMTLALIRHLALYDRDVRAGNWHYLSPGTIRRASDMTVGILGLGRIGKRYATLARECFARVIACDPYIIDGDFPVFVKRVTQQQLFDQADVVSLHVPLNNETRGMVGAALLERMKRGSFLVNTARGGIVDVAAVLQALDNGTLDGAGLDVLPTEPLAVDAALARHPRVLLSPHAAFYSTAAEIELRRRRHLTSSSGRKQGGRCILLLKARRPQGRRARGIRSVQDNRGVLVTQQGVAPGGDSPVMARVAIRGVTKQFGTTRVLHGVDIDIDDGSFTVLVGPSGCGKSTLLRMIAGLEEVSGGEILIGERRVNDVPPKERDIAMVFQNYALYPHMTVRANLAFSLMLAKADKATIAAKVQRAASILALTELLDRYPRQLSGGQRQRVAMGRAIVRDPQVFLFDEPLSNLDAKLRVAMRSEIKELHQRLKTTSVYVTHDQIEAMTMGDKIVVMRDGRIEQTGSPLELYDRPANTFVAGFIGSPAMNFLPATLRRNGTGSRVVLGDGTELAVARSAGGSDGQPVIIGTRPEHLTLASTGIPSQVVVIEPTGADTFVACRHHGTDLAVVFRERHNFAPGSTIHLQPDVERSHLFDAGSGQRLAA